MNILIYTYIQASIISCVTFMSQILESDHYFPSPSLIIFPHFPSPFTSSLSHLAFLQGVPKVGAENQGVYSGHIIECKVLNKNFGNYLEIVL